MVTLDLPLALEAGMSTTASHPPSAARRIQATWRAGISGSRRNAAALDPECELVLSLPPDAGERPGDVDEHFAVHAVQGWICGIVSPFIEHTFIEHAFDCLTLAVAAQLSHWHASARLPRLSPGLHNGSGRCAPRMCADAGSAARSPASSGLHNGSGCCAARMCAHAGSAGVRGASRLARQLPPLLGGSCPPSRGGRRVGVRSCSVACPRHGRPGWWPLPSDVLLVASVACGPA